MIGGAYAYVICMYACVLLLGCVFVYWHLVCKRFFRFLYWS